MRKNEHSYPSGRVYTIALDNGAGVHRYGLRLKCDRIGETRYVGASELISAHYSHAEAVEGMTEHEAKLCARDAPAVVPKAGPHRAPRHIVLAWYDGRPIEAFFVATPSYGWLPVNPDKTPDFANQFIQWRIKHVPVVETKRAFVSLRSYQGMQRPHLYLDHANVAGLHGVHCTITITDGRITRIESDQVTPA